MRNPVIDVFRGVCMLFVVLGHTSNVDPELRAFIYSFHMPAFFMLSGYLFNQTKMEPVFGAVRARFSRLVIPAWFMGLVCAIPFLILLLFGMYGVGIDEFSQKFYGTMTGYPKVEGNFLSTPLWFLFTLFTIEVVAIVARNFSQNYMYVVLLSIGLVGLVASQYGMPIVPFNLFVSMTCMFFFAVGLVIKNLNLNFGSVYTQWSVCLLFFVAYYWVGGDVSLSANKIGSGISIISNVFVAGLGAYFALVLAFKLVGFKYVSRYLIWIGRNTIPIIGFDYYTNSISERVVGLIGLANNWGLIFLLKLAILSVVIIILSKQKHIHAILQGNILSEKI